MLGAASASLAFYDLASGTAQPIHIEVEPTYSELFVQLGGSNPILGWMARQQVGTTVTEGIFLDRPRFESGIFFNEWARPQRYRSSLFTRITDIDGAHGQIAFIRDDSQPLFGAGEIALIDRIAPDLVGSASSAIAPARSNWRSVSSGWKTPASGRWRPTAPAGSSWRARWPSNCWRRAAACA